MVCPTPWCSVQVTISRQRVFAAVFTIIPANKGIIKWFLSHQKTKKVLQYTSKRVLRPANL